MALWNDRELTPAPAPRAASAAEALHRVSPDVGHAAAPAAAAEPLRRAPTAQGTPGAQAVPVPAKESLIAAELSIEGKIQGTGSVRLAGRFKGDVHVDGNVAIDSGAKVEGGVHAATVTVGGELTGNIDKARHVDVLQTGVIVGDVKADSLTVAAGSRMRGHVEFGWGDAGASRAASVPGAPRGHA